MGVVFYCHITVTSGVIRNPRDYAKISTSQDGQTVRFSNYRDIGFIRSGPSIGLNQDFGSQELRIEWNSTMKDLLVRLAIEEDGPTAVEYAVILGLLVAAVIGSVNLVANQTAASFDNSASAINSAFGS